MSQHLAASYFNSEEGGPTIVAVHDNGYIDFGRVFNGRFTWFAAMQSQLSSPYLPGSPTLNTLLYNQEHNIFLVGDAQGNIWSANGNDIYDWNKANLPSDAFNSVKAIAYGRRSTDGQGIFVASGDILNYSTIYSFDGQNWSHPNQIIAHKDELYGTPQWGRLAVINDIIFADSMFVGVGLGSDGDYTGIYYSVDGVTWNCQCLSGQAQLNALTYADNLFVAVADQSTIWYSPDGKNWTIATGLSGEANFKDVTYGNRTFVAVADEGTIWLSPDGKQWTIANEIPPDGPDITFNKVAFRAGQFVAVADPGKREAVPIYFSSDGKVWSQGKHVYYGGSEWGYPPFYDVIYANNRFYAIQRYAYQPDQTSDAWGPYSSTDGKTWDINNYSAG
ncbi:MAG: hypothetical protein JO033_14045 [Acidobacteriaceae bacterium]|nr:hypothetical protein [Acidobacteriaceae bacterium]MBV9501109.1 hypothetical protein [Acidobacteriaceae bacterium]